jgi:hypothetical protein
MVEFGWLGGWNWNWDWLYGLSFAWSLKIEARYTLSVPGWD